MARAHRTSEQGFALVVVSAIFIAFALVASAFIDRTNATQQINLQAQTRAKLSRISNALLQYYLFNNGLYPCPADATLPLNNANYGKRVSNCHNSLPGTGGVVVLGAPGSTEVIRGTVPFIALSQYGLDSSDAIDAWNNRIVYVVNRNATVPSGASTIFPTLLENNTTQLFVQPDFIVMSYGRDGLGATPKGKEMPSGVGTILPTITCPATSTTLRQRNCDTDLSFIVTPQSTAASVQNADYADDILSFYRASAIACPLKVDSWSSCSGTLPATPNGSSRTINNTNGGWVGSATATCTNSTWSALTTTSCTPSGSVVNGVCGSAQGGSYQYTPTTNLCSSGTAGPVTESGGQYRWDCIGSGGGATAPCTATPYCECSGTPLICNSPHDPHGGKLTPMGNDVFC